MEENNLEIKTEEQSADAPAVGKKQKIVSRVVAVLLAAALIFCIYTVTQVPMSPWADTACSGS